MPIGQRQGQARLRQAQGAAGMTASDCAVQKVLPAITQPGSPLIVAWESPDRARPAGFRVAATHFS